MLTQQSKSILDASSAVDMSTEAIKQVLDAMPEKCNWPVGECDAVTILADTISLLKTVSESLEESSGDGRRREPSGINGVELERNLYNLHGLAYIVSAIGTDVNTIGAPSDDQRGAFLYLSRAIDECADAIGAAAGIDSEVAK